MKFVSVRDFRLQPGKIWKRLRNEHEMVVTSNGRPLGVLLDIGEEDIEDTLIAIRRSRALRALERIQKESVERGTDTMSMQDIDDIIRKVRRKP